MIQRGGGLGFAHEALAADGVGGRGFGEELEGDFAVQARIQGFPDHSHAAGTQGREQLVRPHSVASR
jgi:hypothetical protein